MLRKQEQGPASTLRKQEEKPASTLRKQEQEPAGTLRKEQEPGGVTRPLALGAGAGLARQGGGDAYGASLCKRKAGLLAVT